MKQRTTYLVSSPEDTLPNNFVLAPASLHIKTLHAAREDRFTIAHDELPAQIWSVLEQYDELIARWSTGKPYASVDPFGSRVPAGLHIFLTPQSEVIPGSICNLMSTAFGLGDSGCKSFQDSFIEISGAYQFYSPLTSISAFQSYVEKLVCKDSDCSTRVGALESADYIDLKYDAASQTLVINTFWSHPEKPWQETLQPTEAHKRIEVGVLGNERPMGTDSLTLGGFLHVVGKDDKLEPVLFTFASRHFRVPARYSLTTLKPTGLHPKLQLSIDSFDLLKAPREDCSLNIYFILPRGLFIDKYQLSATNPQLLNSLHIKRILSVSGEADLEAPSWGSDKWGSTVLVEADALNPNVELPLHLRYLEPQHNSTASQVRFALPSVFWACESQEWSRMGDSPFDRQKLGWEHLFPNQTMYYHLTPAEGAWKEIDVPVLDVRHAMVVKVGTVVVMLGGFVWVCWKMLAAVGGNTRKKAKNAKKTQ